MRYRGVRIRGWRAVAMLLSAIVAAWLAGLAPAAGQPVLRFGPGDQALRLDGHMALLRDPDGRMTLDDVLAPDARDRFETLPINLSLGYTQAVAWLRFTIENTGPAARALFIEFQPPFIDHIDVFSPAVARPAAAADFHETRLGDHVDIAASRCSA